MSDRLHLPLALPATRGDCPERRPCPHVTCRYHLPDGDCALDHADNGPRSHAEIGAMLGVSRERVVQIERAAAQKLLRVAGPDLLRELLDRSSPEEGHPLRRAEDGGEGEVRRPTTTTDRRTGTLDPAGVPARILAHLRRHGPTDRADLWRALGLPGDAPLGPAVYRLRQLGLIEGGGRRHAPEPYRLTPRPREAG